jgi:hypothetical protein
VEEEKDQIVQELEETTAIRSIATELAIKDGAKKAAEVPKEYAKFKWLFDEEASHRFPPSRPWDHAITLKPGAPDTIPCKIYPMMQEEKKTLLKFIKEHYAKGYIRPSISPIASSFFFIKKKDGKLRPVQDYRLVNSHTVKNQYPLPLISELTSRISRAHIFTKLDVK